MKTLWWTRLVLLAPGGVWLSGTWCTRALADPAAERPRTSPRASKSQAQQLPGIAPAAPAFAFESQPGEVNEALATLIRQRRTPAETTADEATRVAQASAAEAVLRKNSPAAASVLVESLRKVDPDDLTSHAALISLLTVVSSEDTAIRYLRDIAMSGTPRAVRPGGAEPRKQQSPDQPSPRRVENEDPQVLIRYMAMSGLFTAARHGSRRAADAILETLRSPHREVKLTAVQYYYALSKSRLRAKTEMRERLAPADRYLLNR